MKKINLVLTISLLMFISCNKDDSNPSWPAFAPPQSPTHISPADNSQDVVTPTTLSWNESSSALFYVLQVSTITDFSTLVYNDNVGNLTSKQVNLYKGKKYYWRIAAGNTFGLSDYTKAWSFVPGLIPSAPNLISPKNGSSFYSTSVLFKWDTICNAVSYSLQVSTDYNFGSFIHNDSGLTETSKKIPGLNQWSTYYWRVRANNQNGTSSWSLWRFNLEGLPLVPTPLFPNNGASDQFPEVSLAWSHQLTSYKVSYYTLQVSKNSSFSDYVLNLGGIITPNHTISGLKGATTYFWRVSATNIHGTSSYSSVWSFTTIETPAPCPGIPTVTYEGKTYNTVKIKNQCWLKENLDVGTMINSTVPGGYQQTDNGIIEKYCYNNTPSNCNTYGGLYEWPEAMQYNTTPGTQGICPTGWHIPTLAEFQTLITVVHSDGNSLKALDQGIGSIYGIPTNYSGFSALLGSYRLSNGGFPGSRRNANFWSSTNSTNSAFNLKLEDYNGLISLGSNNRDSTVGCSIRCVKDN